MQTPRLWSGLTQTRWEKRIMMADALSQLHGAECLILLSISCSNQKTPYPRNTGRNKARRKQATSVLDALNWGQTRALQCPCSQSQPRRGQSCSAPPGPQQLLVLLHESAASPSGWECCTHSSLHLEGAVEKGSPRGCQGTGPHKHSVSYSSLLSPALGSSTCSV